MVLSLYFKSEVYYSVIIVESPNIMPLLFSFFFVLLTRSLEGNAEDLYASTEKCGIRGSQDDDFRIINGTLASKGEFPWLVSIQVKDGLQFRHICGGGILSKSWAVTAAHCLNGINQLSLYIVAGDYNLQAIEGTEQARRVIKIATNNFDLPTFSNDIALLKLEAPLEFSQKSMVMPVCLPKNYQSFEGNALVAGWGKTSEATILSSFVRFIEIPLVPKDICEYNYIRNGYSRLLNNCQICAALKEGGKDACQGDSGGPLVCKTGEVYTLCGIVSWGIGCARADFPGIYTKVSCFVEWIRNTVLLE